MTYSQVTMLETVYAIDFDPEVKRHLARIERRRTIR